MLLWLLLGFIGAVILLRDLDFRFSEVYVGDILIAVYITLIGPLGLVCALVVKYTDNIINLFEKRLW